MSIDCAICCLILCLLLIPRCDWSCGNCFECITDDMIVCCHGTLVAHLVFICTGIVFRSVRTEVKQQVRRLQYHASVALWAGNNENEAALQGNWYGTKSNYTVYKQDYVTLYVNTVRDECLKNDDTREFLVSSPTNGLQSEKEGYVAKNPYDTHYGDSK